MAEILAPASLPNPRQSFHQPAGHESQAAEGEVTDQHMGQLVGDGAFAPVNLACEYADDDDIVLGEGLPACPARLIQNSGAQIVGASVDV
jgi:hypothetical protein